MSDQHRKQGRVVVLDAEDLERILGWSDQSVAHGPDWTDDDEALHSYLERHLKKAKK